MQCHYITIWLAKGKNSNVTKCWRPCGKTRPLIYCWQECKMIQLLWNSLAVPFKTKNKLYDLAIVLPYTFIQRHENVFSYRNLTWMFTAFIGNSQIEETIQMSFSGKWLNKLWYIHIMEFYSDIKRNRFLIHTTTWMNLKEKKKNPNFKMIHM